MADITRRARAVAIGFMVMGIHAVGGPISPEFTVELELDRADGLYRCGEMAACTVTIHATRPELAGETGRCIIKRKGHTVEEIRFPLSEPFTVEYTMDEPGWLYFGFEVLDAAGRPLEGRDLQRHSGKPTIVAEIGAMFCADQIVAGGRRPDDFDDFWAQRRAQLDQVPVVARLTPVPAPAEFADRVDCFAVEVDGIGNPVTGYLALPKAAPPKSLPACVDFLSFVWREPSLVMAARQAATGVLAFYTTWHGYPVGHEEGYYRALAARDYTPHRGWGGDEDPQAWYWHSMFLRVMRALDFIKLRPEWDGNTLAVKGGSRGGIQAIAAAALDPAVTFLLADVPSFCDWQGGRLGRLNLPAPYNNEYGWDALVHNPRVQRTTAYHDSVNFAPRIRADVFVSTGFTDEMCRPCGVFAFYNALPSGIHTHMTADPKGGHFGLTRNPTGRDELKKLLGEVMVYELN